MILQHSIHGKILMLESILISMKEYLESLMLIHLQENSINIWAYN